MSSNTLFYPLICHHSLIRKHQLNVIFTINARNEQPRNRSSITHIHAHTQSGEIVFLVPIVIFTCAKVFFSNRRFFLVPWRFLHLNKDRKRKIQVLCPPLAFNFFFYSPWGDISSLSGDKQIITEVAFVLPESGCIQSETDRDHLVFLIDILLVFCFPLLIPLWFHGECVQGKSELCRDRSAC